jgi:hypothetical protein
MRRVIVSICMGIIALGGTPQAAAQQQPDRQEVLDKLEGKMRAARHMAFHPVILRAVRSQNNEQLSMDVIQRRDAEWRSAQGETALQRSISQSRASQVLRALVERNPDFNEAFATDNQGANVAMFPATSDYWQGDEAKWINSFNNGDGKVWVGDIELDESTGEVAVQVSVPILDQDETIGVLVIGVTQDYLQE